MKVRWLMTALVLSGWGCDTEGDAGGDGGPTPDAAASCEGVVCGGSAHCEAGACVCNAGLERRGPDCVPEGPPVEGDRTEAVVCAQWASEHLEVNPEFTPGEGECAPTEILPEGQNNAIRRTNIYRWLVGLPPVEYDPGLLPGVQACAVVLVALGGLSHTPPEDTPCYDDAQAAGRSNLVVGTGMADSVDLYVADRGVDDLGHRRWVLEPTLSRTAFGHKGRFGCMDVFSGGGPGSAPFIAWPPAGFVPLGAARGQWSIALFGRGVGERTELIVDRGAGEEVLPFDVLMNGFGSASSTIGFQVPDSVWRDGSRVDVRLTGLDDGTQVEYSVQFTSCRGL